MSYKPKFNLNAKRKAALAAKGITYTIPAILRMDTNTLRTHVDRYIDDESGKDETDILLGRLHPTVPGDYASGEAPSDWTVTEEGDLVNKNRSYIITREQLTEKDWILHMIGKGWINLNSFIPAYLDALRKAGHDSVEILTRYE